MATRLQIFGWRGNLSASLPPSCCAPLRPRTRLLLSPQGTTAFLMTLDPGWMAALRELTGAVGLGDGGEGNSGGRAQGVIGSGFGASESYLRLGECLLDQTVVTGRGRQVPEVGTASLDSATCALRPAESP